MIYPFFIVFMKKTEGATPGKKISRTSYHTVFICPRYLYATSEALA